MNTDKVLTALRAIHEDARIEGEEIHVLGWMPNSNEHGWWLYGYVDTAETMLRLELDGLRESYVEAIEDAESVFEDTQGTDEERRHFADLCRAREDLEHWDASALGQSLAILKGAQS